MTDGFDFEELHRKMNSVLRRVDDHERRLCDLELAQAEAEENFEAKEG